MILLGLKVSIGQSLMLRNLRTGEEVSCRVVCLNPYQLEKREVGVEFIKPFPVSGASPFLPLIGQREAPKRKTVQTVRVARGQVQKRNEIRSRLERRPELDCYANTYGGVLLTISCDSWQKTKYSPGERSANLIM